MTIKMLRLFTVGRCAIGTHLNRKRVDFRDTNMATANCAGDFHSTLQPYRLACLRKLFSERLFKDEM
jgi:hypothetical protein